MNTVLEFAPWFLLGLALGAAYFFLIHLSVRAIAMSGTSIAIVLPTVLRLASAVGALYFAAQSGILPVLIVLTGFLCVRVATFRTLKVSR